MWSAPGLQSLARSATLAAPPAPSLHADGHRAGSSGRAMQPCPLQVPRVLGLRTASGAGGRRFWSGWHDSGVCVAGWSFHLDESTR